MSIYGDKGCSAYGCDEKVTDKPKSYDPKDLIINTFRSDGDVSQGCNAIRITHKPTGIVVMCDKHRLHRENRKEAFDILEEKLKPKSLDEIRDNGAKHAILLLQHRTDALPKGEDPCEFLYKRGYDDCRKDIESLQVKKDVAAKGLTKLVKTLIALDVLISPLDAKKGKRGKLDKWAKTALTAYEESSK